MFAENKEGNHDVTTARETEAPGDADEVKGGRDRREGEGEKGKRNVTVNINRDEEVSRKGKKVEKKIESDDRGRRRDGKAGRNEMVPNTESDPDTETGTDPETNGTESEDEDDMFTENEERCQGETPEKEAVTNNGADEMKGERKRRGMKRGARKGEGRNLNLDPRQR